jgi:hypothetical protein
MSCFGTRKKNRSKTHERTIKRREISTFTPESIEDLLKITEGQNRSIEQLEFERDEILRKSELSNKDLAHVREEF